MCLFTNELLISHLSHRVSSRSALAVKTSTCRATFISISWMACLDPSPAVDRLCLLRLSWLQWLVGRRLAVDFTPQTVLPRKVFKNHRFQSETLHQMHYISRLFLIDTKIKLGTLIVSLFSDVSSARTTPVEFKLCSDLPKYHYFQPKVRDLDYALNISQLKYSLIPSFLNC